MKGKKIMHGSMSNHQMKARNGATLPCTFTISSYRDTEFRWKKLKCPLAC